MRLLIDRIFAEAMIAEFPDLSILNEQLKIGSRAELNFDQLSEHQLSHLQKLYQDAGQKRAGHAAQISTLLRAVQHQGKRYDVGELEFLLSGIAEFLISDGIRGWLFKSNQSGKPIAYLVSRIDFTPPGEEESGRILLELKANSMGKLASISLMITERDIVGKTIAEVLATKGYFKETAELVNQYDSSAERYFQWRSDYGRQFSGQGTGIFAQDPEATHRSTDWARKSLIVLSSSGGSARLVNDEEVLKDRDLTLDSPGAFLNKYLRKAGRSTNYNESVEKTVESLQADIPTGMFTQVPVHGYVLMYHLDLHHHVWVHVDDMQPYVYQPDLKDKLILPPEQTDLIDILTAEMDVLMDDIVEGKSGGTTVLCAGPAGVGKTLTAEVYSEIIQRPLYRVHSGELGLNVAEMEVALKNTLTRAQRWGAVMLIDEADVYIKRRDDNIAANAVVGVFLRVLEYFNGLLFLTTNRVDDIDEAIISRCIALIKYHPPHEEDRLRIWQVMSGQFALELSDQQCLELAQTYPTASGRDIKGLAKLVAKYCHHKKVAPDMSVFKRCSMFRAMSTEAMSTDAMSTEAMPTEAMPTGDKSTDNTETENINEER